MSTHVPGFKSFSGCLHHFVLAKLATSSIRVNRVCVQIAIFTNKLMYMQWRFVQAIRIEKEDVPAKEVLYM